MTDVPKLSAVAYVTRLDGKIVRIERKGNKWIVRRGQMYVVTTNPPKPHWDYKRYSMFNTVEAAARAAVEAPREGIDADGDPIREGWWGGNW